jgi:hypothetical protein
VPKLVRMQPRQADQGGPLEDDPQDARASHGAPAAVLSRVDANEARRFVSCRVAGLRREWPFVQLSAGLSTRRWSQLASIRTFHRWLRVQRSGWPGATPRSVGTGTGSDRRVDHSRLQDTAHGVAHAHYSAPARVRARARVQRWFGRPARRPEQARSARTRWGSPHR